MPFFVNVLTAVFQANHYQRNQLTANYRRMEKKQIQRKMILQMKVLSKYNNKVIKKKRRNRVVECDEFGHPIELEDDDQEHEHEQMTNEVQQDNPKPDNQQYSRISGMAENEEFANDSEIGDLCEELMAVIREQELNRRRLAALKLQKKQKLLSAEEKEINLIKQQLNEISKKGIVFCEYVIEFEGKQDVVDQFIDILFDLFAQGNSFLVADQVIQLKKQTYMQIENDQISQVYLQVCNQLSIQYILKGEPFKQLLTEIAKLELPTLSESLALIQLLRYQIWPHLVVDNEVMQNQFLNQYKRVQYICQDSQYTAPYQLNKHRKRMEFKIQNLEQQHQAKDGQVHLSLEQMIEADKIEQIQIRKEKEDRRRKEEALRKQEDIEIQEIQNELKKN
eukprot:TRINITY_DN3792_c0_g1_i1.p1 TRINITY_DN3792_c0_g1~~TRINITY_DN3792_c0_g1_i1.p1  ORF type:complete len:393 (+),score=72.53 TRINITY_DN3792_c0_g1_i1:493-1671(+)